MASTTKTTSLRTVQLVIAITRWHIHWDSTSRSMRHRIRFKFFFFFFCFQKRGDSGSCGYLSITDHRPSITPNWCSSHLLKWNGIEIRNGTHRRMRHRRLHQTARMRCLHWVHSKRWNLSVRSRRCCQWSTDRRCKLSRQRNRSSHRHIRFHLPADGSPLSWGRSSSRSMARSAPFRRFPDSQLEALRLRRRRRRSRSPPLQRLRGSFGRRRSSTFLHALSPGTPGGRRWNVR